MNATEEDDVSPSVMGTGRLEAFSDGVIAVIITIMVLELHVPHGARLGRLGEHGPHFLTYALSFINIGIYWSNHHHLLHATKRVDGPVLWANLNLLFWLSLIPFSTGWAGENHFESVPTAAYGGVLLVCGLAYTVLSRTIIHVNGKRSAVARVTGRDVKGWLSASLYAAAIPMAFFMPAISGAMYVSVAMMWLIPDRRLERVKS